MEERGANPRAARKAGRPLSFDRSAALEKAMLTFWRHGYETTSISDLTEAMGITAPSLYTAFGNKEKLFLEAVRLYAGEPADALAAIDGAESAFGAAINLLKNAAVAYTGEATPPGCLLASATASGSAEAAHIQAAVAAIRQSIFDRLRYRIHRDIASDRLPASSDAEGLAGLTVALMQGMSVMARDGAPRALLLRVVNAFARGWPDSPYWTQYWR